MTAAAEVLPQPQAISAAVYVDVVERTLFARLPDQAGGYQKLLWTEAWQKLRRGQQNGWPADGPPWLWCDLPGARRVVHGEPGEAGTLKFTFPPKAPGWASLVSKPGVVAIVTVDRSTHFFLSCRFFHRPA